MPVHNLQGIGIVQQQFILGFKIKDNSRRNRVEEESEQFNFT